MTSTLISRNVMVNGHRTSMRLEPLFWAMLMQIGGMEATTTNRLVTRIAADRAEGGLTSAVRTYCARYFYEIAMTKILGDADDIAAPTRVSEFYG